MIEKTLELNLQNKTLLRRIHAVQADSGRTLKCIIADGTLPSGVTARIYARKPSGKEVYNDCTIDGNAVVATLTTQLLAEIGNVPCQIEISMSDADKVTTFKFEIVVEESLVADSAIESSNEYSSLEKLVQSANTATAKANTATTNANKAASSANSAATKANTATTNANKATTAAKTAASTANASAAKADTATANANTATAAAKTATDNAQAAYDKLKDFDATTVADTLAKVLSTEETTLGTTPTTTLPAVTEAAGTDEVLINVSSKTSRIALSNLGARLLNAFSWSALATTAKTIIGAINELNTNLTNATYGVGDTFTTTVRINTAGFITNSSKQVLFTLPLSRALSSKVTKATVSGIAVAIRQNGNYCYGGTGSTDVTPPSVTVTITEGGLQFSLIFTSTTNVVNNAPCGVAIANGLKVTFS